MTTLRQFIKDNRQELDKRIERVLGGSEQHRFRNDEERRQWILNDEGLYLWARSKGVKI